MSDERVRFDRFCAEVAALAVVHLDAPVEIASAMWSEAQPFPAHVQYGDEALTFHRSVLWRGHRVRLAWPEGRHIVFYFVDHGNPGAPPPPHFEKDSGQPLGVRVIARV